MSMSHRDKQSNAAPARALIGMGVAIVSTSRGIMTGTVARERSLGGEILCYVW